MAILNATMSDKSVRVRLDIVMPPKIRINLYPSRLARRFPRRRMLILNQLVSGSAMCGASRPGPIQLAVHSFNGALPRGDALNASLFGCETADHGNPEGLALGGAIHQVRP